VGTKLSPKTGRGTGRAASRSRGSCASSRAQADADGDGDVDWDDYDGIDYGFWFSGRTWALGDFDGDGRVDYDDYDIIDSNRWFSPNRDVTRGWQWSLDAAGNWAGYQVDANGDGDYLDEEDLDQTRAHNAANELTGITGVLVQRDWAWGSLG